MSLNKGMIGLAEAAHRLQMPYQDCHRLLLIGVLGGEKRNGRWYVRTSDVDRFARNRRMMTTTRTDDRV
jgi:hypothetical protein